MNPELDLKRSINIANRISMAALTRAWQMLLKGLNEAQISSQPIHAVEMILIRLAYIADIPTPADLIKTLNRQPDKKVIGTISTSAVNSSRGQVSGIQSAALAETEPEWSDNPKPQLKSLYNPETFEEVISLADKMNERILRNNLINNVHLVRFKPGAIVLQPSENLPREFSHELTRFLNDITDRRWVITISLDEKGAETYQQHKDALELTRIKEVKETPFFRSVFEVFPGAEISEVRDVEDRLDSLSVAKNTEDNN